MNQNHVYTALCAAAMLIILTISLHGQEPDEAYARRSYRPGATLSEIRAVPFPDSTNWPGARLFLSRR